MIISAVHIDQGGLEVGTDLGKDRTKSLDGIAVEHLAAILCHKYQVYMNLENTMSSVSYILVICHRPNYNVLLKRLRTFKFETRPSGQQKQRMRRFAGSRRFVFNRALALQKECHKQGEKRLGYAGLCQLLTAWRHAPETAWLADAPVHPLQQALKDLEQAYAHFFAKRCRLPRFKKKGRSESFRYPDPKQIKLDQANGRLFLPKLGWLRYRNSRKVLGEVKQVAVCQLCEKWFVSIQTERCVEPPLPQGGAVGIDLGITRFATLSDGAFYAPLNSFKRHETALRKAQQAMSRKTTSSNNWKKAKGRVQRLHARIRNGRRDELHKTTTTISKNHAIVCIEDLKVRNMSKSAAGSTEQPGTHVRAKSGLNKSILDQGWFEFRRQLAYKLQWSGGLMIPVPPQNTSRTYPRCGHVSKDNRQTQSRFACEVSGAVMPPAAGTLRSDSLRHTA